MLFLIKYVFSIYNIFYSSLGNKASTSICLLFQGLAHLLPKVETHWDLHMISEKSKSTRLYCSFEVSI